MKIQGEIAVVTGGASGLGAATAAALAKGGAKVAIIDRNEEQAKAMAGEIGGLALCADVADEEALTAAFAAAKDAHGPARILINCAGIGGGARTSGRDGPHPFDLFVRIVTVNLIGTFNAVRLFAAEASNLEPLEDGERGVAVMTASVAAYDGQIGQAAYSASKGGIVGMTLPIARDLSGRGVRICTIAPGVLETPLLAMIPEDGRKALGESIPFPRRLGKPEEYASLALHICDNAYLNGETIRLDGALRMAPK